MIVCGATIDVLVKMLESLVRVESPHLRVAKKKMKKNVVIKRVKRTQSENHSRMNAIHALAIGVALSLAQKWLV
jgi:hypothetical protein